jgi:hypothetical protein
MITGEEFLLYYHIIDNKTSYFLKKNPNSMTGHFRTILMTVSSKTFIKINNSENERIG